MPCSGKNIQVKVTDQHKQDHVRGEKLPLLTHNLPFRTHLECKLLS